MKILGVDPALANVGWCLLDFDPFQDSAHFSGGQDPNWLDVKKNSGQHTYHYFHRLAGGVFSTTNVQTVLARLLEQARQVYGLVEHHRPDLLVLEAQLEVGQNRCTWGVALQTLILAPYFPGSVVVAGYRPRWVVTVGPHLLQAAVHGERSTRSRTVVERYGRVSGDPRRKVALHHEADAYFLGIVGGRFWATCLTECWDRSILSDRERRFFLKIGTGMLFRQLDAWWQND